MTGYPFIRKRENNQSCGPSATILCKGTPLELVKQKKDVSCSNLCRFSGGGDVSSNGPLVIEVPKKDKDEVTPLKKGDMATTSNTENKVATNSRY